MKTKIKEKIFIAGISIAAIAVRLAAIFKYGQFWDDEMFNFIYSQKPWPHGLIYWIWETNPPLHLFILKLWFLVFPATEFFARLPSLIIGLATVYLVYILAKTWFDKKTALLAALFMSLHAYHVFWSATARVYAFLLFLGCLSALYFHKIFIAKQKNKTAVIVYALTNLLLLFSHLTSLGIFACQFIILVAAERGEIKSWIKINLIPFVIAGGWIGASLLIKSGNSLGESWFLNMRHTFDSALSPLGQLAGGPFNTTVNILVISIFLALLAFTCSLKNNSRNYTFLLIYIFIPLVTAAHLGLWHVKFFLIVLPFVVIAIAYSLNKIFSFRAATIIIIILSGLGLFNLYGIFPLTDWRFAENYIQTNYHADKKQILLYNNFILKSQIDRYLANITIPSQPFDLTGQGMSWDDLVVKKNYLFINYSDDQVYGWMKDKGIENYQEIFLLQGEYDYMTHFSPILENHGWKLKGQPVPAHIFGDYNLYLYEKN